MTLYPLELQANIIQLIVIIVMTVWFAIYHRGRFEIITSLFFWGLLAHVLMNVYWVSMILVDGVGNYITFTACDTAITATLLIWITMYQIIDKIKIRDAFKMNRFLLFQILFGIWNTVWWTIWSGNVFLNILWGVLYASFAYMLFYTLIEKKAITIRIRVLWDVLAIVLALFQIPIFGFKSGSLPHFIGDLVCNTAWLVLILAFAIKAIKDRENRTTWFFVSMLYSLYAQYLTDGVVYSGFVMIETLLLFCVISCFDLHKENGL